MTAIFDSLRWPDRRVLDLLGIEVPITQAPMAGISTSAMAVEVTRAGDLGSLPLAKVDPDDARAILADVGTAAADLNLILFRRGPAPDELAKTRAGAAVLAPFFAAVGLPAPAPFAAPTDSSFGHWQCDLVERSRPKAVNFHFGLALHPLLDRVRAMGAKVLCSATTLREAAHSRDASCDAGIVQGLEAGGHRGSFRAPEADTSTIDLVARLSRVPIRRRSSSLGMIDVARAAVRAAFCSGVTPACLCPDTSDHRRIRRIGAGARSGLPPRRGQNLCAAV